MGHQMRVFAALVAGLFVATSGFAGPVKVEKVVARPSESGWRFDVTLSHADKGWEHYADAWEIRAPDGTVLGTRVLAHPHVAEQPFTRSLSGVAIPPDIRAVQVLGHDKVHGWGAAVTYALPD